MSRETGFDSVGGSSSSHGGGSGGSGSSSLHARFGLSPRAFRNEISVLKRELFMLSRELREVVDPAMRQRMAREIAKIESQLMERDVQL